MLGETYTATNLQDALVLRLFFKLLPFSLNKYVNNYIDFIKLSLFSKGAISIIFLPIEHYLVLAIKIGDWYNVFKKMLVFSSLVFLSTPASLQPFHIPLRSNGWGERKSTRSYTSIMYLGLKIMFVLKRKESSRVSPWLFLTFHCLRLG